MRDVVQSSEIREDKQKRNLKVGYLREFSAHCPQPAVVIAPGAVGHLNAFLDGLPSRLELYHRFNTKRI